jgi:hypothetical protein
MLNVIVEGVTLTSSSSLPLAEADARRYSPRRYGYARAKVKVKGWKRRSVDHRRKIDEGI